MSIRRDLIRFSFHIYNNRDDADEVVRLAEQWLRARGGVQAPARKTA
jgi:selenocysteine lyase/cysteine desulfurase